MAGACRCGLVLLAYLPIRALAQAKAAASAWDTANQMNAVAKKATCKAGEVASFGEATKCCAGTDCYSDTIPGLGCYGFFQHNDGSKKCAGGALFTLPPTKGICECVGGALCVSGTCQAQATPPPTLSDAQYAWVTDSPPAGTSFPQTSPVPIGVTPGQVYPAAPPAPIAPTENSAGMAGPTAAPPGGPSASQAGTTSASSAASATSAQPAYSASYPATVPPNSNGYSSYSNTGAPQQTYYAQYDDSPIALPSASSNHLKHLAAWTLCLSAYSSGVMLIFVAVVSVRRLWRMTDQARDHGSYLAAPAAAAGDLELVQ
mmetsp:Transcript_90616/g.255870  ORF Transcript_90616/g.255870 Transcript_90616/m.255870 type:complete len:317 (-) Transcript_90616:77-1027(-)|eukprot:CAMPEP_0117524610 /NCGR_PEP_ID=MMETSP0784-20121206/35339_1 /TAXON_ID=39447 /ORGANISM="" /LENGTH=316 /DNA_ID=CAMNT_0005320773 /DNA_START=13 /DNA_END=963 /DNA_ORIENTATION=-